MFGVVAESYLASRLEFLLHSQNADGGWGYFPGKQSWFEPTAYAMLALHGAGEGTPLARAWALVGPWQLDDGGWRPAAQVESATWVTALGLTLCCVQQRYDHQFRMALHWLLRTAGAESSFAMRAASYFHFLSSDVNVSHKAWPWRPGTASWIEPTAHALLALKSVPKLYRDRDTAWRIREGEAMILARRDRDGGWNSGNPNVFKTDQPSYPETTALAMLGLQGRAGHDMVTVAEGCRAQSKSSLANAWLAIAMRCYGASPPSPERAHTSPDVMLAALEALGHNEGNYRLFRTSAMTRRKFIPLAGLAAGAGYLALRGERSEALAAGPPGKSGVVILKAQSYSEDLVSKLLEGARACGLDPRGKRVLLKPNLVEFDAATVINTDVAVLAAAVELFHRLGAAEVRIGEGPGHRRDTYDLAAEAKYRSTVAHFDDIFVDLNRDDVTEVRHFANEPNFFFPNSALAADLIVSLAKMKTHHWAGVTLGMKNLFGLVPGLDLRMAQEQAALYWYSRVYRRDQSPVSEYLRHRGRHHWHGR